MATTPTPRSCSTTAPDRRSTSAGLNNDTTDLQLDGVVRLTVDWSAACRQALNSGIVRVSRDLQRRGRRQALRRRDTRASAGAPWLVQLDASRPFNRLACSRCRHHDRRRNDFPLRQAGSFTSNTSGSQSLNVSARGRVQLACSVGAAPLGPRDEPLRLRRCRDPAPRSTRAAATLRPAAVPSRPLNGVREPRSASHDGTEAVDAPADVSSYGSRAIRHLQRWCRLLPCPVSRTTWRDGARSAGTAWHRTHRGSAGELPAERNRRLDDPTTMERVRSLYVAGLFHHGGRRARDQRRALEGCADGKPSGLVLTRTKKCSRSRR